MATLTVSVTLSALLAIDPPQRDGEERDLQIACELPSPPNTTTHVAVTVPLVSFASHKSWFREVVWDGTYENWFFVEKTEMPTVLFADTKQRQHIQLIYFFKR